MKNFFICRVFIPALAELSLIHNFFPGSPTNIYDYLQGKIKKAIFTQVYTLSLFPAKAKSLENSSSHGHHRHAVLGYFHGI